jgi:ABC-type multidrug transport system ATPase subunit
VDDRTEEIISIMNLQKCRDRKIEEYPDLRGEVGSDLRRLSIALEIAGLPPVIVIEDPTTGFDPAVAVSILSCLQTLAARGHIVICSFGRPSTPELEMLDRVVLMSVGFTIFSSSPKQLQPYFCSPAMGYELKQGVELVDFMLDISTGTERPTTQRTADLPVIMQEKFEGSEYSESVIVPPIAVSAFSWEFFFLLGYAHFDSLPHIWSRLVTVIKRAFMTKFKDVDAIRTGLGGATVLAIIVGYLQLNTGTQNKYAMNLIQLTYPQTANVCALLFFSTIFSWAFPFLNAHVICQKLQLYRYERQSGICTTFAFAMGSLLSEVPFNIVYMWIFATIIFFMADLGQTGPDYVFYVTTVGMNSLVGLGSVFMLSSILRKELIVRDFFLLTVTLACLLSGFPFQLPQIRGYMADASSVNPLRWTFEGLMSWRFHNYEDATTILKTYGFQDFQHNHVYAILGRFIAVSAAINLMFLVRGPNLLRRKPAPVAGQRAHSMSRDSTASVDAMNVPADPEVFRRRSTRQSESVKPILFMRESSVTGRNSKLSINLSQVGEENMDRGPTVLFKELTYVVRDRTPFSKKKNVVLNRVSGLFDWGKLSMILGGAQSGKSSLLHVLAADIAVGSYLHGRITFNGRELNPQQPAWQRCGFVTSQNDHLRDLTVRQNIEFAMKLRMYNRLGFAVLQENVAKTAEILNLVELMDRKAKTLNPGEMKRLAIAEEMVHGPKLLLMDEPLTGVSQYEASVMMMCFREMVNQDRTVVASVHQPSAEIFKLFDTVLLLSHGRAVYFGPVSNAANFFVLSPFGYDLSNYTNPADFLADIAGGFISDSKGDFIEAPLLENYYLQSENFNRLRLRFGDNNTNHVPEVNPMAKYGRAPAARDSDMEGSNMASSNASIEIAVGEFAGDDRGAGSSAPFLLPLPLLGWRAVLEDTFKRPSLSMLQLWLFKGQILMHRSLLSLAQRYELVASSVVAHTLLGCLFGWIMGPSSTTAGVYNTTSFFAVGSLFLILFNLIFVFFMYNNHQVFLKEYTRGLYPNFLKWVVLDWPLYTLRFINAILFTVVVWSLTDQPTRSEVQGFAVLSFMFMVWVSSLLTEIVVSLAEDRRSVYLGITSLGFTNFCFSGLFVKAQTLPHWMRPWVPSLSMIRWNMQGVFIDAFQDNARAIPAKVVFTGILNLFGWGGKTMWYCFYMLLANILVYKVVSFWTSGFSAVMRRGGRRLEKDE